MNQLAPFTALWATLADPVNTASGQMITNLMAIIGAPFEKCVIAYFIISFLIAAYSPDDEAWTNYLRQLGLAAVIYALATNAGTFNYYVTHLVQGMVNSINAAIAGAFNQPGINAGAFDRIAIRALSVGLAVFKDLPWYSLKMIPLGMVFVVYWFLAFAAVMIMFFVYLVGYIITAFLIGIGPLFIALYFFPYTRRWFDGWLRNLMTGVLVQVFTAALASMFVYAITALLNQAATGLKGSQAGQTDGGVVVAGIMMLVVTALCCVIFGILSLALARIAASIAGGVHSEVTGLARLAQAVRGGGRALPPPAGGQGGADAGPGGGGAAGRGATGVPPREYAFNRNVGSAL